MRIFNRIGDAPVDARVRDLVEVLDLLGDDLPVDKRSEYTRVADIAADRLALDPDMTVVALIGATGSGKSSLFNALLEVDLAPVGVRRPTTTSTMAASAPGTQANAILDWLQIKNRVYIPAGLGLSSDITIVDMPDVDSVNEENRQAAQRLAQRADILIWVVDPQKYADDVLHSHFIKPYAKHSRVTIVALTQVDLLSPGDQMVIVDDLRGLLADDGLQNARIVLTSAKTGQGIAELRMHINDTAQVQRVESARLKADVSDVASRIRSDLGQTASVLPAVKERDVVRDLTEDSARAAGAPEVADAVRRAYIHRAKKRVGWLPTRYWRNLRPDPLKRWHLGEGAGEVHSLRVSEVSSSALQVSLRSLTERVAQGRPRVWANDLRAVASEAGSTISDDLNEAVASTDLAIRDEPSRWWRFSNALQWLGWLVALAGALWLAAVWASREFLLINWDLPRLHEVPYPTWMLLGGLVWTLVVVLISHFATRIVARRLGARAGQSLRASIETTVRAKLWAPLHAEDQRQRQIVDLLSRL